jgi:hypothetical protein
VTIWHFEARGDPRDSSSNVSWRCSPNTLTLLIAQFIKQRLSPHHSYRQLPSVTFWWLRLGVLATIAVFTNHEWAAWLYAVQSRDEWADLMFNEPSSSAQKVGMSLSSL